MLKFQLKQLDILGVKGVNFLVEIAHLFDTFTKSTDLFILSETMLNSMNIEGLLA